MNKTVKLVGVSLVAFFGIGVLSSCGTESTTQTSQETQEATQAPVNPGNSEGLSQMLPPVIVEENQTEVTVNVGDFLDIVVSDPPNTRIETDNTGILSITQGYSDGSAVFNPGAKALAVGQTVVLIQNPDQTTRELAVTVE